MAEMEDTLPVNGLFFGSMSTLVICGTCILIDLRTGTRSSAGVV